MTVYHFVGIKGTGMSSLAQILHDMKHTVQGSDYEKRFFTQTALEKRNISILPFDLIKRRTSDYCRKCVS